MPSIKPASLYQLAFALLLAMACQSCSSPSVKQAEVTVPAAKKTPPRATALSMNKGQRDLRRGIKSYENAAYETAARQFQSALDHGLAARSDRVNAYKYLAFVACTSDREQVCHVAFRKALEIDPKFKLAPAEAGHPIWGPVFRSVKDEVATKAKAK